MMDFDLGSPNRNDGRFDLCEATPNGLVFGTPPLADSNRTVQEPCTTILTPFLLGGVGGNVRSSCGLLLQCIVGDVQTS
jgi:hypothetical protein